jgi:hypothetical protein
LRRRGILSYYPFEETAAGNKLHHKSCILYNIMEKKRQKLSSYLSCGQVAKEDSSPFLYILRKGLVRDAVPLPVIEYLYRR